MISGAMDKRVRFLPAVRLWFPAELLAVLVVLLVVLFPSRSLARELDNSATSHDTEGQNPTQVRFIVFVLDIDHIDGATQSFNANVYMHLRWKDERLQHSEASARTLPLHTVWNPRIVVANQQGIIRQSLPDFVEVKPDGTVIYRQRYVGVFSQPLDLSDFPMDQHQFRVQFAAIGFTPEQLEFVPDFAPGKEELRGGGISDQLSLPDWDILRYQALARPYRPVPQIIAAGFALELEARRHFLYYFWQVIVPLVVVVAMSWAAFWIDPSLASSQISIAVSSILTLIAYRFVVRNLLPRLPYMTRMDYFLLASTLFVFLALVEVILTTILARGDRSELARRIDRVSRLAFPVFFLVAFAWSIFG